MACSVMSTTKIGQLYQMKKGLCFVNLNESIALLGHDCDFKSDDTFDLIILLAKILIYKCKVKKNIPQFHFF